MGQENATRLYGAVDPFNYESLLSDAERAVLGRLRAVLDRDVKPLVNDHWDRGEFPEQIRGPIEELDLMSPPELAGDEPSALYKGFRMLELARTDVSVAVFYGAQATLFRNSILLGGSPEQVARFDPGVRSWAVKGVFALTEPDHGSDVAQGLETTARRQGDAWVLSGAKRWIGGAAYADYLTVVARDEADGQVKAFLVDAHADGVAIEKIERKIAVRIVNNGDITLDDVVVPEAQRLQNVSSFKDVNRLLRSMRADVSWLAVGAQAGAYEAAVRYTGTRTQFGRPIAGYQLVQDKLATMLGNLTASLGMAVRLSQLEDAGGYRNEDAALAKGWIARRTRETVALAREVAGGNGITLDTDVARFFADAEAIYTFEGTNEINQLVVGRAITGISAFVG
ncbi:acyl-CoA dehydrogenase family protein [Georgenia sp. SYP-B2076]|uniref:acyl-CoA dehydrogenase family protein n=1 Tax=Georgenia sp. SYP-B2076 TaxID=2495881 RepID=UPI000F8EC8C1|nr:acyl-CoA dehydrogenase family protein [Georgenia sp. SYP-B2076]